MNYYLFYARRLRRTGAFGEHGSAARMNVDDIVAVSRQKFFERSDEVEPAAAGLKLHAEAVKLSAAAFDYVAVVLVVAIVGREHIDSHAVGRHVCEHVYDKGFLPAVRDGFAEHLQYLHLSSTYRTGGLNPNPARVPRSIMAILLPLLSGAFKRILKKCAVRRKHSYKKPFTPSLR